MLNIRAVWMQCLKFIRTNLDYPKAARRSNTEGVVYVMFIVEKDGKLSGISVIKGIHTECDAEALRVVTMFPDWKPGRQDGRVVRSRYVLPIKFVLTKSGKKNK